MQSLIFLSFGDKLTSLQKFDSYFFKKVFIFSFASDSDFEHLSAAAAAQLSSARAAAFVYKIGEILQILITKPLNVRPFLIQGWF